MTQTQKQLARHALGLPNREGVSYRNRFVLAPSDDGPQYRDWLRMVEAGWAERRPGDTLPYGGCDLFWMTPAGALLALEPGERLDREDFPR